MPAMYHVYNRRDMDAVHAGELDPGPALTLEEARADVARLTGRTVKDISRFVSPGRFGGRPRIFIAGTPRVIGYIIARTDDPARQS